MEKKTVLIVEDSQYLAESLIDMLEIAGHDGVVAQNGRTAISMALEMEPDLILLDIRLPDIDGYEVYRKIRADDWGKDAKILILTASESTENISKNIDLPVKNVLFKPEWSVTELIRRIEEELN